MKKIFCILVSILYFSTVFSQSLNVSWGDEFKLHKGSTDLSVVCADNSGVYLKESHQVLSGYFVVAYTTREAATLIKLNNNLAQVYSNDFNKELRGKEFTQFFPLQDKLFIIATNYSKKDKTLTLYGAEVNKETGDLAGEWQEITSWQKEEKGDDINYRLSTNTDSSKIIVVSSVQGKEKNTYEIKQYDKTLKATDKPVVITNEFDPKTYQLEDVIYTVNKKIILVGRVYEYEEGKKKKAKFLDFTNYNIRIYNEQGAMQKQINTDISGKWLVSSKVAQTKDKDLVLAAFYSNEKKGKDINGLLVQRIDPNSGGIISTSQKEINTSLITTVENDNGDDDDDADSRKERKEKEKLENIQDENEGFSKYMRFRNIFYTPDNGLVILAEKYHHYTYVRTTQQSGNFGGLPGDDENRNLLCI